MNKILSTDLNKLNTSDIVNRLSNKKEEPMDIRKLIQQKTIQAQQLKKNQNPSITSLNFNTIGHPPTSPQTQSVPNSSHKNNEDDDDLDDYEIDDDDDADIDAEIDDDENIEVKSGKNEKAMIPKNIILQEDDTSKKPSFVQPVGPKNVNLPSNIDFGIEKLANKEVLVALSDDDDEEAAKKLYSGKQKTGKNLPKQKIKRPNSLEDENQNEDEDEDEDEDLEASAETGGKNQIAGLNGSHIKIDTKNEDNDEVADEDEDEEDNENEEEKSEMALNLGGEAEDESDNDSNKPKKNTKRMSRQELNAAKRKELTKIERCEKKGYKPSKKFSMADNYDDIVAERERLEDEKGCDESIKWQRKILMGVSTGIEYLNKIYDPFDLQLNGWSESVYENINDYDEVFEELYHKYKNKVKVAPEIKLIGMFAGSALMFHFSKTLFSKASDQVPGFDDVMKENPDLKAAYEQAALRKLNMNNNQGNTPMSSMIGNFLGNPMIGNMLGGLMNKPQPQAPPAPTSGIPSNYSKIPSNYSQPNPHQSQTTTYQPPSHQPSSHQPPSHQPSSHQPPSHQTPSHQPHHSYPLSQQGPPSAVHRITKPSQSNATPANQKPLPLTKTPISQPNIVAEKAKQIEMDGPNGVDDLLASLTKGTNADLTELQLSDADTEGSLSELGSNIKSVNFNKRTTKTNNRKRLQL